MSKGQRRLPKFESCRMCGKPITDLRRRRWCSIACQDKAIAEHKEWRHQQRIESRKRAEKRKHWWPEWKRQQPHCKRCRMDFELPPDTPTGRAPICPQCGKGTDGRPPNPSKRSGQGYMTQRSRAAAFLACELEMIGALGISSKALLNEATREDVQYWDITLEKVNRELRWMLVDLIRDCDELSGFTTDAPWMRVAESERAAGEDLEEEL